MGHANVVLTAMKEGREYRQCDIVAMTHLTSSDISRVMELYIHFLNKKL